MTTTLERIRDLQTSIGAGRIEEAMTTFYADHVVMQENSNEPCVGLAENLERERAWLATVKEFKGYQVLSLAADDTHSFVEVAMTYVDQDDQEIHLEQVTRATWEDGKIVSERFFHG